MAIEIINPFTGAWATIPSEEITDERLLSLANNCLGDDMANELHATSETPEEWLALLISAVGPETAGILWFS